MNLNTTLRRISEIEDDLARPSQEPGREWERRRDALWHELETLRGTLRCAGDLAGHYRRDDGRLVEGVLTLDFDPANDQHVTCTSGSPVKARRYRTAGVECIEIKAEGQPWEFLPDEGECERIGLTQSKGASEMARITDRMIPVEVQQPCKPASAITIGEAPENWTPEQVWNHFGLPADDVIDAKVIRRKGDARWSLVAWVTVKVR